MKYISKIFQPLIITPKNAIIKSRDVVSKSQRVSIENEILMMELGVVRATSGTGLFAFLPMGMRSLNKLVKIVDSKLSAINAQKISLPILVPEELWIKSKRFQTAGSELMTMNDRHDKHYILGPTHEETITDLIAAVSPISPKTLPIRLYQIGNKFRDEMRPRYGVVRSREFLMKDLYTFDVDEESAKKTYELVNEVYKRIFTSIGLDYIKVEGLTGAIGGTLSHEYHCPASIGEDVLLECASCGHRTSQELVIEKQELLNEFEEMHCPRCDKIKLKSSMGIEVGHTFLLGTKYSSLLKAHSVGANPLQMGCYGLGLSRIIGAALEMLSSEAELRWPAAIAPYTTCIIGPKRGSKETNTSIDHVEEIYSSLIQNCISLKNDVVIDDRTSMTIGKRILEARRFGYPYIIVVGQKAMQEIPEFELMDLKDDSVDFLNKDALIAKMKNNVENLRLTSDDILCEDYSVSNDLLNENSLK